MGRWKNIQRGLGDSLLRMVLLGLAAFLAPLVLAYAFAHPSGVTMTLLFGLDLSAWIVGGVVGVLAFSISGTRRILVCKNCSKMNLVSGEGAAVCRKCKSPL